MLRKRELLQIPVPECPEKEEGHGMANLHIVDGILNINIFSPERYLEYRFFSDGKNGIVYITEKDTWTTNQIREDWRIGGAALSKEELKKAKEFDNDFWMYHHSAENLISGYFGAKNARKRQKYENNKYKRIQRHIDAVPDPPADLPKFCDRYLFGRYSALRPKGKKKTYTIHCLHCGHEKEVETPPKHKSGWECPHCKSQTTVYKQANLSAIREKDHICVFRRTRAAEIAVFAKIRRSYHKDMEPQYNYEPEYIVYKTAERTYRYKWWSTGYGADWIEAKWNYGKKTHLYTWNLKALFPEGLYGLNLTRLKGKGRYDIQRLLGNVKTHPAARQLFKIGCISLAEQTDRLGHPKAMTFEGVTGVDSNYKPLFRKYDYGADMAWKLRAIVTKLNEGQVQKLDAIHATREQIRKTLRYMTPQKLINYFYKQVQILKDADGTTLDLYVDYMEMTERLNEHLEQKIDLTATIRRFPRNIKTAHDAVAAELKALINREKDKILKQLAEKYRREIRFAYRGLAVVFPSCAEDFVQEGTCLHHCVGSHPAYVEKQAEEKYLTVFIRKEKEIETPYYTATFYLNDEIRLKECHGLHNKSATDTVKAFLERYENYLNKKMKKQQEAA